MNHLSRPILNSLATFFRKMDEKDQEAFLWIWDAWLKSASALRQHVSETNAAKGLFTIGPVQKALNLALVFDVEKAEYRRSVASGALPRSFYPDPGSNRFRWPEGHSGEVREGDLLVFEQGAARNESDFLVETILDDGVVTLQAFQSEESAEISYRVDRGLIPSAAFVGCAEVHVIDPSITSIPLLCTTVGRTGYAFVEGADFVVGGGFIGFYQPTPKQHEEGKSFFFAPEVIQDEELPFQVFGYPIGFRRPSSDQYVRGLQALWFALWNGPSPQNVGVGVSVVFGLPFATPGEVTFVGQLEDGSWEVHVTGASLVVHKIPAGFTPNVKKGDVVGFQSLTDASQIIDYISDPGFVDRFGLEHPVVKYHTFFVLIQHEALRKALDAGSVDLDAVIEFVERIKDVRTDFHLLIDLRIREDLSIVPQAPMVDAVIMPHSMVGPNWANRLLVNSFGSSGLAHVYGYRDDYSRAALVSGVITSVDDADDELVVEYDEDDGLVIPEDGALAGKFLELACSTRISGDLDPGVWAGTDTVLLSKAAFPDWVRASVGDILFLDGGAVIRNQEAYAITEVEDLNLSFGLVFDRDTAAEDGMSFTVRRLYEIKSNLGNRITLVPSRLAADGLNLSTPGSFFVWRKAIGGQSMRRDYEAGQDSGRYDFSAPDLRRALLLGCDAVQFDDRVRITAYEGDETVRSIYDERDDIGSIT